MNEEGLANATVISKLARIPARMVCNNASYSTPMCQLLVTLLGCGHRIRGPLLQCPRASQQRTRGPPHDDGCLVLCPRSEPLNVCQNTCCEECFSRIFLGFLGAMYSPCRGNVMRRMRYELLDEMQRAMPTSETASAGRNSQLRRENRLDGLVQRCEDVAQRCRGAEAWCSEATRACNRSARECIEAMQGHPRTSGDQETGSSRTETPDHVHWSDE